MYTAQQLANAALTLMAQANMPATDENLALATATRQMLRAIAAGQLVLAEPKVDPPAAPAVDSKPSEDSNGTK